MGFLPPGPLDPKENNLLKTFKLLIHKAEHLKIVEVFAQGKADVGCGAVIRNDVNQQAAVHKQAHTVRQERLFLPPVSGFGYDGKIRRIQEYTLEGAGADPGMKKASKTNAFQVVLRFLCAYFVQFDAVGHGFFPVCQSFKRQPFPAARIENIDRAFREYHGFSDHLHMLQIGWVISHPDPVHQTS